MWEETLICIVSMRNFRLSVEVIVTSGIVARVCQVSFFLFDFLNFPPKSLLADVYRIMADATDKFEKWIETIINKLYGILPIF